MLWELSTRSQLNVPKFPIFEGRPQVLSDSRGSNESASRSSFCGRGTEFCTGYWNRRFRAATGFVDIGGRSSHLGFIETTSLMNTYESALVAHGATATLVVIMATESALLTLLQCRGAQPNARRVG